MNKPILSLLGSGGHASVVLDAVLLNQPPFCVEVFDESPSRTGLFLFQIKIQAGLPQNPLIHIAIGNNQARYRLGKMLSHQGKKLHSVIHPKAVISRFSTVAGGCFIAANVVIGPNVQVEAGCIVNHSAVIDHDCKIGAWTHIAPQVTLGGGVQIDQGCLIGAGAVILPQIHVGENAIVGAGAVVTRSVKAGATVVGVPAV